MEQAEKLRTFFRRVKLVELIHQRLNRLNCFLVTLFALIGHFDQRTAPIFCMRDAPDKPILF